MLIVLQNIIRFVVLVSVQVLILNNIQFLGYINPYLYIYFILSLPVRVPRWAVLVLAFMLGLLIDMFSNTMGLHAFATVFVAFVRNPAINLLTSIDEGVDPEPSVISFGWMAYLRYFVSLVLLHNILLFTLESFSFVNIGIIFLKTLLSSIVTSVLILAIQMLKKRK
ncbi:MAG: rod shape-determining protein MreD [Prevotellaceae bacterium]|nr:rod shape-determining protein MreD [Prevotellaceae bacterium]